MVHPCAWNACTRAVLKKIGDKKLGGLVLRVLAKLGCGPRFVSRRAIGRCRSARAAARLLVGTLALLAAMARAHGLQLDMTRVVHFASRLALGFRKQWKRRPWHRPWQGRKCGARSSCRDAAAAAWRCTGSRTVLLRCDGRGGIAEGELSMKRMLRRGSARLADCAQASGTS